MNADGYTPKIGTKIKGLITSSAGSKGAFKVVSAGTPPRTTWSVAVHGVSLDATLVKTKH